MTFNFESRLMLIAPHPDDEALACSIALQRAVAAGAKIRVVYATDGDDNPWPQRVLARKWHIDAADRKRWGKLRRSEALSALRVLGVEGRATEFLALPDQGLTNLLRTDCRPAVDRFAQIIRTWSPTHLLVPSILDTHPDHSALAVILRLALAEITAPVPIFSYAVHGKSVAFSAQAEPLLQSENETEKKLQAILCHTSQIMLSRKRFLAYASRPERILEVNRNKPTNADGSIRSIERTENSLRVKIRPSPKLIRRGDKALFLLGCDANSSVRCLKTQLRANSGEVEMLDASGNRVAAHYHGNRFGGEFTIPLDSFSADHALFVKLERRSLFFDEAGWLEVAPTNPPAETASITAIKA